LKQSSLGNAIPRMGKTLICSSQLCFTCQYYLQAKGFQFQIILILCYILSSANYDVMNMHHKPVVNGELILLLGVVQILVRPPAAISGSIFNWWAIQQIIMRNNLYILVIKFLVHKAHKTLFTMKEIVLLLHKLFVPHKQSITELEDTKLYARCP
jgi:hypothetical protein